MYIARLMYLFTIRPFYILCLVTFATHSEWIDTRKKRRMDKISRGLGRGIEQEVIIMKCGHVLKYIYIKFFQFR